MEAQSSAQRASGVAYYMFGCNTKSIVRKYDAEPHLACNDRLATFQLRLEQLRVTAGRRPKVVLHGCAAATFAHCTGQKGVLLVLHDVAHHAAFAVLHHCSHGT